MSGRARSTVLGWRCPWSGDERDPIPRSYRLWYRLFRSTRIVKHLLGWHDWREPPAVDYGHPFGVARWSRCDWCGAVRVRS